MSIIHKLKLILMKSARNYKISMTRILAGVSLAFFASGIATAANESSSPHADAIESILQQKAINGKVLDAAGEPMCLNSLRSFLQNLLIKQINTSQINFRYWIFTYLVVY